MRFVRTILVVVVTAALMATAASGFAADTTEVVFEDTAAGENQPGWLFNRDASTSTPFEFNSDAASIGQGSLYVAPIGSTPADKFIGEYFFLGGIDDFDSIAYDFLIGGGGTSVDAVHFYLNVYTNLPGTPVTNFFDCRFDFVPTSGSTAGFTTVSVDGAAAPTRVQSRGGAVCPTTLGGLPAGSTIRVFAVNVGDTSANDADLDGFLDRVVLSGDGMATTFDFEPMIGPPTDKDECKRGGWAEFNNPEFRNQGDCVSYVASKGRSR